MSDTNSFQTLRNLVVAMCKEHGADEAVSLARMRADGYYRAMSGKPCKRCDRLPAGDAASLGFTLAYELKIGNAHNTHKYIIGISEYRDGKKRTVRYVSFMGAPRAADRLVPNFSGPSQKLRAIIDGQRPEDE